MIEMLPLYILALCSMVIAIFTFVNFVLLVMVWRRLGRRDRARGEIHTFLRYRIHRIEDFLLARGFKRPAIIPDSKVQTEVRTFEL